MYVLIDLIQMNQVFNVDIGAVDGYRRLKIFKTTTRTLAKWRKRKDYGIILNQLDNLQLD
jgi:hypothetical protein